MSLLLVMFSQLLGDEDVSVMGYHNGECQWAHSHEGIEFAIVFSTSFTLLRDLLGNLHGERRFSVLLVVSSCLVLFLIEHDATRIREQSKYR